jgi:SAM-dependent methyltransferase
MNVVEGFYDPLAELYHLIYENWPASIERQGGVLDSVIRERSATASIVADVACGIGTQSLGLASRGYTVIASDVSHEALDRARREARERALSIDFRLDDMRELKSYADGSVDVVIACDNAVPHLLTDAEIETAFRQFHRVLRPGGVCVVSVRDYAAMPPQRLRFVPFGIRELGSTKVLIAQGWEYEGEQYRLNMYFTFDDGERVETRVFRSRYYAIPIDRLMNIGEAAGLSDVQRIDDRFFQPLIVASRIS